MNQFWEYAKHYAFALMATILNGGVVAVAAVISKHEILTIPALWGAFKVAACLAGLGYMYLHPLPVVDLPPLAPQPGQPAPVQPVKAFNPFTK